MTGRIEQWRVALLLSKDTVARTDLGAGSRAHIEEEAFVLDLHGALAPARDAPAPRSGCLCSRERGERSLRGGNPAVAGPLGERERNARGV